MVFFQSALLGGYAYADWLARRPVRRQAWLHGLLAAASLAVLPIVLGGPSQPLDVGRTQRLVTPAIRAALEVRDGGCVFPG